MTAPTRDRWWTALAPGYDLAMTLVGWHRHQDALVADLPLGTVVLEVGCGPAHAARGLGRAGAVYVGLDRNAAMLAQAGRRVRPEPRAALVRADVTRLPFADDSVELVVATAVLALLTAAERRMALGEMARVARAEVRLLEPVQRSRGRAHAWLTRVVAFVREHPVGVDELVDAGLSDPSLGPPVLLGVYSPVRARVAGRADLTTP